METTKPARVVRIGGLTLTFLVDETDGAGEMIVFEFAVEPRARVPAPHFHQAVDEAVYGLSGTLTTTIDGTSRELRPGDVAFIPRGAVHHHENRHDEPAKALVVLTPGSIGRRYFEEMAEAVAGPGKPDPARIAGIMERHGLIPA
ncbi:cupin domain-containing protein [Roseomonas stagni]|uniref:Cupin domain-containing protein n=1 Tax=Falsiroseomonas algicola TaxID=2716930 RepID=A0A6M1LDS9_9PROT|nr:cupin domain-containing protein [Falsiroseomonas algicola]NGM18445.1 cupin domain-containing protein [Falsiroseomonas algicola]